MRIQHNILALNTYRSLGQNSTNVNKALEKLSSGYKINKAGDDAAGLAISEKMRGQIRGLTVANKNAQDGISLIQTAEGAMNEVHSLLQRGRELAVQAANDTSVEMDREALQAEIEEIKKEVTRIGTDTEFNTIKILQGPTKTGLQADDLNRLTAQVKDFLEGSEQAVKNAYGIAPTAVKDIKMNFVEQEKNGSLAWVTSSVGRDGISVAWEMTFDTLDYNGDPAQEESLALTTLHEMTHAMMSASGINWDNTKTPKWFKEGTAEYMTGGMSRLVNDLTRQNSTSPDSDANISILLDRINGASDNTEFYSASYATTRYLDEWLTGQSTSLKAVLGEMVAAGGSLDDAIQSEVSGKALADFLADLKDTTKGIAAIKGYIANAATNIGSATGVASDAGLVASIKGQAINEADNFKYEWSDNASMAKFSLQIGANEGQVMEFDLPSISASALNISNVDVSTRGDAAQAITLFDIGIQKASTERATLGALQNRLEHTMNNLGVATEKLTSAVSRIRDTDMAKEMMNFTKQNILMQAAQSMLSQANQQPQGILQLLN